jgi:hypothetical protein
MTTNRNVVQTRASAYLSDQYPDQPITFNVSQSVWDWSKYDIIHQTSNSHHITLEEAQGIIEQLTEVIAQLNK